MGISFLGLVIVIGLVVIGLLVWGAVALMKRS